MKLRLLLTILGLSASPQLLANWYEIELLVFSRSPDATLKESFQAPSKALPFTRATVDLMTPALQPSVAELLGTHPACTEQQALNETLTLITEDAAPSLSPQSLQALESLLQPPLTDLRPKDSSEQRAEPLMDVANQADFSSLDTLKTQYETQSHTPESSAQAPREHFNASTCQMEHWTEEAQLLSRPLTSEELARRLPVPEKTPLIIVGAGTHEAKPYLLSKEQLTLTKLATELTKDAAKELLLHTAWRQPLSTQQNRSRWYAGQHYPTEELEATDDAQGSLLMQQVQKELLALEQGQHSLHQWFSPWQLDSLLSIRGGRTLQFDGTFFLRQAQTSQPPQIEIRQQARLSLGQLNYLDHPRLGVIVQVKRFEPTALGTSP